MLLIYENEGLWATFPPEDLSRLIAETDALHAEVLKSGEFVGAYGVGDQHLAKQVTRKDGDIVVTDGPYIETKEYLGSFTIVDVDSEERAYEIAALNPFARYGEVEVRPLLHEWDPNVGGVRPGGSRPCCGRWRRRSSAPSCAGTGTSTCARTPCRRRCWRRRS